MSTISGAATLGDIKNKARRQTVPSCAREAEKLDILEAATCRSALLRLASVTRRGMHWL